MSDLPTQKLEDRIDEAIRLSKEVLRYCELIYKDRELMNDAREDMAGLKQRVVDSAQHVENVVKDSQHDITQKVVETQDVVEQKVDEVTKDVVQGITGAITKSSLSDKILGKNK